MQRRVVGQQPQQHLAQDIDLSGGTVTAVHLHRTVTRSERSALGANSVGGDVGLQPAEQRVRAGPARPVLVGGEPGGQDALQLSGVAAQCHQQGMCGGTMAGVVPARHHTGDLGQSIPQRTARMRQPQMQVVVHGQRLEQFQVGAGQSGVTEQRHPGGQIAGRGAQPGHGPGMPHVGRVGGNPVDQFAPQVRLPLQIGPQVSGVAGEPVDQQLRALPGIRGEQPGQAARHRVAATQPQFTFLTTVEVPEMGGQRRAPGCVETGVDDLEQRPHQRVRCPRILVSGTGQCGEQRTRVAKRHPGADAVAAQARAQDVGQTLTEPALHAARRYQHEILGERIGQRGGQHVTESVGEQIGAVGPMEMKRHRRSHYGHPAERRPAQPDSTTLPRPELPICGSPRA